MHSERTFFKIIFIVIFIQACSNQTESLIIASSSNMQMAMEEIVAEFKEEYQINCEIVYSSSGKLSAQISQGAPYDVFISADLGYPQELHDKGFTESPPVSYAHGLLILFGEGDNAKDILLNSNVNHIAIANPKTAPYGRASKEFMEELGVYHKLESKLVYGENIQQATQFIETGAAEIGITSKSFLHVSSDI